MMNPEIEKEWPRCNCGRQAYLFKENQWFCSVCIPLDKTNTHEYKKQYNLDYQRKKIMKIKEGK